MPEPSPLAAVVQILDTDGTVSGSGFVAAGGVVLTCAHVVVAAGGGIGRWVPLRFPQLDGVPRVRGLVLAEGWADADAQDVAVLRLEHVPVGAAARAWVERDGGTAAGQPSPPVG
jgi:hypothetical protein